MTKDKRFLIGLGTGLIIGAILLQLMYVASSAGVKTYTQDEVDVLIKAAVDQTLAQSTPTAPSAPTTP